MQNIVDQYAPRGTQMDLLFNLLKAISTLLPKQQYPLPPQYPRMQMEQQNMINPQMRRHFSVPAQMQGGRVQPRPFVPPGVPINTVG